MRLPIRLAAAALIVGGISAVTSAPASAACNEVVMTQAMVPLAPGSSVMVHYQATIPYSGMTCVLYQIFYSW